MEESKINNLKQTSNEFFWMWFASISPIVFGSFFIKLIQNDLNYLEIVHKNIEVDVVFGYVATMISPFLFMLAMWITKPDYRKELKRIKFGGLFLVLSIVVSLLTTGVFTVSKMEPPHPKTDNAKSIEGQIHTEKQSVKVKKTEDKESVSTELSFSNRVLLLCYIIALIIWYYTLYLKNMEPPNLEKQGSNRIKDRMGDVDSVVGGGTK